MVVIVKKQRCSFSSSHFPYVHFTYTDVKKKISNLNTHVRGSLGYKVFMYLHYIIIKHFTIIHFAWVMHFKSGLIIINDNYNLPI